MNRWFFLLILFVWFTLKVLFVFEIPVLGDEAYYLAWGMHGQPGYYDHPPMIGWWATFAHLFPNSVLAFRFLGVLVHGLVAFLFWRLMLPFGANFARTTVALVLVSPVHWLAAVMAPDVPLFLFYSAAVVLFYFSQRDGKLYVGLAALSGIAIGLAFLSKYFAVTFFMATAVYALKEKRKATTYAFLMSCLLSLPFFAQHFYWNWKNCFSSFGFHFYTRQVANDGPIWVTLGGFFAYIALLSSPPSWFYFKRRADSPARLDLERFLFFQWSIPILFFGLTAIKKGQGLHWYLVYVPMFLAWVSMRQSSARLSKWSKSFAVWSGAIALVAVFVVFSQDAWLHNALGERRQKDWIIARYPKEFKTWLRSKVPESAQAAISDNYTYASILNLNLGRGYSVGVFGHGNRFGRAFDDWINWSDLAGKDFFWFSRSPSDGILFQKYFKEVIEVPLKFQEVKFQGLFLRNFNAHAYLKDHEHFIATEYYPFKKFAEKCRW